MLVLSCIRLRPPTPQSAFEEMAVVEQAVEHGSDRAVGPKLKLYRFFGVTPPSTPRSKSLRGIPNPLEIVTRVRRFGTLLPRSIRLMAVRCRPQWSAKAS